VGDLLAVAIAADASLDARRLRLILLAKKEAPPRPRRRAPRARTRSSQQRSGSPAKQQFAKGCRQTLSAPLPAQAQQTPPAAEAIEVVRELALDISSQWMLKLSQNTKNQYNLYT
jgi:hypothetical protein